MTKDEAIGLMQQGKRITHRYFTNDEWMTMVGGKIVLEDGVVCTPEEFWKWRQDKDWLDGYNEFLRIK